MSSGQELRQCIAITKEGKRCSRPARDGEFCYHHDESNETIEEIEDQENTEGTAEDGAEAEPTEEPEGKAEDAAEPEGDEEAERAQQAGAEGDGPREQKAPREKKESMETNMEEGDGAEEAEAKQGQTEDASSSGEQIEITRHEGSTAEEEEAEEASTETPDETADDEIKEIRQRVGEIASEIVGYPFDGIAELSAQEDGWVVAVEVIERSGIPDTQDIIGRYELQLDEDLHLAGYHRTHRYRRDDMDQEI